MKKLTAKTEGQSFERIMPRVGLALVAVFLLGVVMVFFQMKDLERGMLDVCATQQDGYVQLVVDQIALKDNRTDEEIISEILSTLDASTNRYWAFSRDQNMLFVKDVVETNRYKGFTAEAFFDTPDASSFYEGLSDQGVTHKIVSFEDKTYVASGASFTYEGKMYRLCLMTNAELYYAEQ